MRRVSTASFLPFSSYSHSHQAGSADHRHHVSHSSTATAVLELDEPAPDSGWGRSEAVIASSEPVASDNLRTFPKKPFGGVAASEKASMPAAHQHPAVGSWRLISSEATTVDDEGNTEVIVTENPQGYIMFTPWGRMMTVCVGGHSDRKKVPTSQADFSDLWKRMLAYTGPYRIEGDEVVTNVEISWYPLWAGTEQRRKFTLEGNKLTIVTIPQPMGTGHRAKSMVTCKVVWERES